MGAWGHLAFDNDTANDWAYGLEDTDDLSLMEEALEQIEEAGAEYLDQDIACIALAALRSAGALARECRVHQRIHREGGLMGRGPPARAFGGPRATGVRRDRSHPRRALGAEGAVGGGRHHRMACLRRRPAPPRLFL